MRVELERLSRYAAENGLIFDKEAYKRGGKVVFRHPDASMEVLHLAPPPYVPSTPPLYKPSPARQLNYNYPPSPAPNRKKVTGKC